MLPPVPDGSFLQEAKVLLCDNDVDTGATMELTCDSCMQHVAEMQSAVIYQKPPSSVRCEHVWRHTAEWIHFSWDVRMATLADCPVARHRACEERRSDQPRWPHVPAHA